MFGHRSAIEAHAAVIFLNRCAKNYEDFISKLDVVRPRYDETPFIPKLLEGDGL